MQIDRWGPKTWIKKYILRVTVDYCAFIWRNCATLNIWSDISGYKEFSLSVSRLLMKMFRAEDYHFILVRVSKS